MAEDKPGSNYDLTIGWVFILGVLAGLCWLLWYFFHTDIRDAIRWWRYAQMWMMHWVMPSDFTVVFNGQNVLWHEGFGNTGQWSAPQLTDSHLGYFNALAMQPLRYVFIGIMLVCAYWCVVSGPRTHNRKSLGLQGLIEFQSKNFPVLTPFIDFNPSKQPPRPPGSPVPAKLPLFAEALGPEEWLAYNNVATPDGKVSEKSAAKAFQKQLIGRWGGAKRLKPYQQILLAAFCLKGARKRDEADHLLGRIAICWSHDKGLQLKKDKTLLKEARQILADKKLAEATLAEANRHAFITTALLRALQYARSEGGVLAPAQFAWLRGHDRNLWYPMNNLGRQSFHMEAMGAMSHFKAERLTRRPIPVPKMEGAVEAIVEYMASIDARPIPDLSYDGTGKTSIKKAV